LGFFPDLIGNQMFAGSRKVAAPRDFNDTGRITDMDILSVVCKVSLIDDKKIQSVNLEIARSEKEEKIEQIWKVIDKSTDSLFVPAPRWGTWEHGSPFPALWLSFNPEGETERTLLYAEGIHSEFLRDATCGKPIMAKSALYYVGRAEAKPATCEFSLWCS
jgi:hypothetical protein